MNILKRGYYLIFKSSKIRNEEGNTILLKGKKIQKCDIKIKGKNNILILEENSILRKTKIRVEGENHKIVIGKNSMINRTMIEIYDNNGDLIIGNNVSFAKVRFIMGEGKNVTIGDEALFSYDIEIRNTDSHRIFNEGEDIVTNIGKDIVIKKHVWIGAGSKILKGVTIGEGAIVGGNSVVVKNVEANTIVAGNPAKKIREKIYWEN